MFRTALLSSAAITLTMTAPAFAQDTVATGSASSTPEQDSADRTGLHDVAGEEIIVTAPFARAQTDVLSGTSVLTGTELTRELRPTVGDTLARQPGVSATSFGPNVSRPVLRGFQGERIRILTDGIGSIDVSNTSADHATAINPLTAERIEVLRGPASLLFGSSAIGGVVNVIDNRIPRTVPAAPAHFDVIATYGSAADETSIGGVINIPVTENIVFHADGSYLNTADLRTGGYLYSRQIRAEAAEHAREFDEPELLEEAEERGKLANSAAETTEISGGLSYIGSGGSIGFAVTRYDNLYGVPGRFELEGDHGGGGGHDHDHSGVRLDLQQTRVDVRGELETGDGFIERISVRAARADYQHDEIESDGGIGTSFFNEGYEGRIEAVQSERDGWTGAIGGQFFIRDFDVEGEEKFLPANKTRQFGIFTLQSKDFGALRAEAGARYEHSNIDADADADLGNGNIARSFDAFSFSLGASYPLMDGLRIGLNGSRSERAPSAEELFANGPHIGTQAFEIGDPDFEKESSWGLEATLKGQGEGYRFALSAYHNWFDNYIYDYQPGTFADGLPVFQYAQADARYYGLEGEFSARLAQVGGTEIRGDILGDYVHATIDDSNPAPRIPPLRLLAGLEAKAEKFGARVEVEHAFEQDRVAEYETTTDAYTMVNASIVWTPMADNATSFILSANNLLDVEARRHASVLKDYAPLAGRDIRVTARFHF
ncbi:TonB-dependent receptor [Citromicrobium bathyomarinum]|uniref:TonB-dependent receptor domain-containing protein n=1 Tax=Citromicrobium bathyomarinum TaxID=72174 RepID=UPI00315A2608